MHLISQSIDPPWRLSAHSRPHLDLTPDPLTALRTVSWVRRLVQEREDLLLVERVAEVHRAKAEGRLGVLLHSQNASQFGLDLDLVAELYAAGLRVSGLAYNVRSLAADGCIEESNAGLSLLHAIEVAGVEHVGLGLDYWFGMEPYTDLAWPKLDTAPDDGAPGVGASFWNPGDLGPDDGPHEIEGIASPADMPNVTGALLEHGLSIDEVAGVMGGNWTRVLETVWRRAGPSPPYADPAALRTDAPDG